MGSSNKVFVWLSLMLAVALLLSMISSSEVSAARDLAEATKSTSASKQFIKNNKDSTKPATGVDEKKKCGGYGGGNGGYGGYGGGYGGNNGGGYGGDNGGGYGGNGGTGYGGDNGGGYGGNGGTGYGGGYGGNGGNGYGGDNGGGYGGNGGTGYGGGGYGRNNGGYGSSTGGGGGYGGQGTDIAYDPIKTSSEGVKYKGSSSSVKSIPAAPLGGSVASGYKGGSSKSSTPEDDKALQAKAVETKANKP